MKSTKENWIHFGILGVEIFSKAQPNVAQVANFDPEVCYLGNIFIQKSNKFIILPRSNTGTIS